jgi:geranylgeranyl diphosphate synthase type I
MTGFELYLKTNQKAFDRYLATFFGDGSHPDMQRYLYGPLSAFSDNSGKRHRPLICLLACEAVGGDPERAWPAAAAIEHFHTAALIHDDIEDRSRTRRDEPCMHVVEGDALAINAGDLALALVCGTVVNDPGLDDGSKIRVLGELVSMTTRTIEGQALDIGWARDGGSISRSRTTSSWPTTRRPSIRAAYRWPSGRSSAEPTTQRSRASVPSARPPASPSRSRTIC